MRISSTIVDVAEIHAPQAGLKEPYDWDEYAQFCFPKAEELVSGAEKGEKEGNKEKASELYLYFTALLNLCILGLIVA